MGSYPARMITLLGQVSINSLMLSLCFSKFVTHLSLLKPSEQFFFFSFMYTFFLFQHLLQSFTITFYVEKKKRLRLRDFYLQC